MAQAPSMPGRASGSPSTLHSSFSPPQDQLGLQPYPESTALTSPTLSNDKPTIFQSLDGIQEAAETDGLVPPPVTTASPPAHSLPTSYYTASAGSATASGSQGNESSAYVDPIRQHFLIDDYLGNDDNFASAFGSSVDPLYADDGYEAAELSPVQGTRSRTSSYDGLGIKDGRSPSGSSGRKGPYRFPSNPDRPGSPLRLPTTSTPVVNRPSRCPQRLPLPWSPGAYQDWQPEASSSSLCLPPSPSSAMPHSPHSPRAPSPLAMSWEAPKLERESEHEPELVPQALAQQPQTPQSVRLSRVPVPSAANAGTTRRMVEAWENHTPASATPTPQPPSLPMPQSTSSPSNPGNCNSPSHRRLGQQYLAVKESEPLPIPTVTPIPASATMPWPPPSTAKWSGISAGSAASPRGSRVTPIDSPSKERSPAKGLSPSWLFNKQERQGEMGSPKSPGKERISFRQPIKEFKNVLSNMRRNGQKDKDEPAGWATAGVGLYGDRPDHLIDDDWFHRPLNPPVLDRMGDAEMNEEEEIHSGRVLWLSSSPDHTYHDHWRAAWATLSRMRLKITYLTDDLDCADRPDSGQPDVELCLRSCSDVVPIPAGEVERFRLPPPPEQGDFLMLEFRYGAARYLVVVNGAAQDWVSALLLGFGTAPSLKSYHDGSLRLGQLEDISKFGDTWVATSSEPSGWQTTSGCRPSWDPLEPSALCGQRTDLGAAAVEIVTETGEPPTPPPKSLRRSPPIGDCPEIKPTAPLQIHKRKESGTTPDSGATQTQHTGATGTTMGMQSQPTGSAYERSQPVPNDRDGPRGPRRGTGTALRAASLQQVDPLVSSVANRIRNWQPSHNDPPPEIDVSRSSSLKSTSDHDPSDLNPSRSASQIRSTRNTFDLDLAGVDAGLERRLVFKETPFGPRLPAMRKAVPKYMEGPEATKEAESFNIADSARLPDHEPVPEPVATQQAELPTSPRPKRLDSRIAAAMERFEGSPTAEKTAKSPPANRPAGPSAPLFTAKSSPATSPISTAKPLALPRSTVFTIQPPLPPSPLLTAKSPKPLSVVTPIHAPIARQTTSAAFLEDLMDEVRPMNARAASVGSATSVRDRIEALSRAAAPPVATPPLRLPVAATNENLQTPGHLRLPHAVALPAASLPAVPRSQERNARPHDLGLPSQSVPPSRRSKGPAAPFQDSSTLTSRRTLTVANPDPHSPPQPLAVYAETVSESNDNDGERPVTTTANIAKAEGDKRQEEDAAQVAAREAVGTKPVLNLGGPDASHVALSNQLRVLNDGVRAVASRLNETTEQQASQQAVRAADMQQRLVAINEGVRSVHGSIQPGLREEIVRIQAQLGDLMASVAALHAAHASRSRQEPVKDEQGAVKPPPPGETTGAAATMGPAETKAEEPVARSLANIGTADAAADMAAEPTVANKALDSATGEHLPTSIKEQLDNLNDNMDFLSEQVHHLKVTQQQLAIGAGAAGAQAMLARLEQMDEAKVFGESRQIFEAEEKVKAAEKRAEEATTRAEEATARADEATARAEAAEKAEVAEPQAAEVVPPQPPAVTTEQFAELMAMVKRMEIQGQQAAPPPPPPPPPAVTAEEFDELKALVHKIYENQIKQAAPTGDETNEAPPGEDATSQSPAVTVKKFDALVEMVTKVAEDQEATKSMVTKVAEDQEATKSMVTKVAEDQEVTKSMVTKVAEDQEAAKKDLDQIAEDQEAAKQGLALMNEYSSQMGTFLGTLIEKQRSVYTHLESRYDEFAARDSELYERLEAQHEKSRAEVRDAIQSVGLDLHQSISGERLNFIEAMQTATNLKLENHMREFMDILKGEVVKAHQEEAESRAAAAQFNQNIEKAKKDGLRMLQFFWEETKDHSPDALPDPIRATMDRLQFGHNNAPNSPRTLPTPPLSILH
ncbi:hypothetical protein CspeluHIS016_0801190 [Cutaneotrichosporon spelunceum]|uniref:PH domain-containing protein n=1 Tax=Cutaneotrichosporon spelunceum TaxID=1672016 RepID=A0AAD3YEU9_9TREE|nr:hypothetical protein CspeluHIS016_0801190 [Cutaneotrichosporon spelunceum]